MDCALYLDTRPLSPGSDKRRLVNASGIIPRYNSDMKCLLCTSPLSRYLRKNGYWIYRCPVCHLCETDLKKDYEKFVKEFYSEGYYEGDPTRSAYADYEHDKPLIVANMRKFLSFFNGDHTHRKLLDVGCAFGYFVELALSQGYDAYGLDPSSFAVGKAKELVGKSRIIEGTIEHTTYPKASFDVITLFDVFEHLQDPLADMKKLATVLKSDGVIIIATGDTKSLAAQVMKRRWTFFIPPRARRLRVFFPAARQGPVARRDSRPIRALPRERTRARSRQRAQPHAPASDRARLDPRNRPGVRRPGRAGAL